MEKLVLLYTVSMCDYAADVIEPFEYESKEKAENDMLEQYLKFEKNELPNDTIFLNTLEIKARHIDYDCEWSKPQILTLEEWFEKYKN